MVVHYNLSGLSRSLSAGNTEILVAPAPGHYRQSWGSLRGVLLSILASYCRDLPSNAVLSRVIIFGRVSSRVAEAKKILLGRSCRT